MNGGSLGYFPSGAIVAVQPDPYSAKFLASVETAQNLFESAGPTFIGGRRRRRTQRRHRQSRRKQTRRGKK